MPTDRFVVAAADASLLDPEQVAELDAWAAEHKPDPSAVAAEAVRRGWMTPFQSKEVLRGRGSELTLGPYRLLELVGEGGMGRVFRARHTRLGREAAVKVIRPAKLDKPAVRARFRQEILATAQLSHPNVVLVLDADEAAGTHYFAMEFVDGTDLGRLVKTKGRLPVVVACEYVKQAAAGLHHAHEAGLVHRDVKPANLLVTPKGQVKVLDLGLARLAAGGGADASAPGGNMLLGTPDYLAPEQARNPLDVDARADIYSLAGTMYFLLTGKPPVDGETATEKMLRHCTDPPPSLRAARPDAPAALDAILTRMLAKSPADRPQTMAEVVGLLAPFTPGGVAPGPAGNPNFDFDPGTQSPPRRFAPRPRPWLPIFLGLALVGGLAAGGWWLLQNDGGSTPDLGPLPKEFTNSVGMAFVAVPAGSYLHGSPPAEPGRTDDEPTPRQVALPTFAVSTTEVTHQQMAKVLGRSPAVWPGKMRAGVTLATDSVTFPDATEFCRKLSEREADRRPGWAYRLPTDAEWEYFTRGGTATPFWSGGKLALGRQAVFDAADDPLQLAGKGTGLNPGHPHPAGTGGPNPFGLFDTSGGVWEWLADGATVRGGSWKTGPARCRSASRMRLDRGDRRDDVGFRVVFAPPPG
jgi:serine/threonine protein kinase